MAKTLELSETEKGAEDIDLAFAKPGRSVRLTRLDTRTRVSVVDGGEESERRSEGWLFDEDSYTVGVCALFERRLPAALPSLLVALIAPALQMFICFQVYRYLIRPDLDLQEAKCLYSQLVCSALCVLQISDEAVEGLHKMIFAMRWALGIYDMPRALMSQMLACGLGFVQLLMGVSTCTLCILVIFTSANSLETFFNYVALAFVSDVDNMIMGSRIVRNFLPMQNEVEVQWAESELTQREVKWTKLGLAAHFTCLSVVLPFSVAVNLVRADGLEPPVQFHWLSSVPGCVLLWFTGCGAMYVGSTRIGTCLTSLILTLLSALMQVALFMVRVSLADPAKGHECFWVHPPEKTTLWVFTVMMLPVGCAAERESFGVIKAIPMQVKIVVATSLLWVYELRRYGCA